MEDTLKMTLAFKGETEEVSVNGVLHDRIGYMWHRIGEAEVRKKTSQVPLSALVLEMLNLGLDDLEDSPDEELDEWVQTWHGIEATSKTI